MKTLLIATTNPAKREEILLSLQPLVDKGVKIITLNDVELSGEPKETGLTFEENAKIKAQYYADATGLPTLADDGGLMIDALNGEPGVKSKRWLGYEASDNELITFTLKRLKGLPEEQRTARLQTCVCFYNPSDTSFTCHEEHIEGTIAEEPSKKASHGFPYRALLVVKKFNKYYDELRSDEHEKINHRLRALQRLLPKLEKSLVE